MIPSIVQHSTVASRLSATKAERASAVPDGEVGEPRHGARHVERVALRVLSRNLGDVSVQPLELDEAAKQHGAPVVVPPLICPQVRLVPGVRDRERTVQLFCLFFFPFFSVLRMLMLWIDRRGAQSDSYDTVTRLPTSTAHTLKGKTVLTWRSIDCLELADWEDV
jgi:hypothetical protein